MPNAQRLPKKHLTTIQQGQDELRLLAQKSRQTLEVIEGNDMYLEIAESLLREIESSAYRIALSLTELRFTDDCTGCPCAPSSTPAQIHLMVLADELERQANLARQMASPATVELTTQEEVFPFLVEKVAEYSHVEFPIGLLEGKGL
ncbi:MAG: hypothetical protein AAF702_28915 [Chloroflexota bacterium]